MPTNGPNKTPPDTIAIILVFAKDPCTFIPLSVQSMWSAVNIYDIINKFFSL